MIDVYNYTCMCIYIYIYIYIHTHIYVYVYVCIYIYIYMCVLHLAQEGADLLQRDGLRELRASVAAEPHLHALLSANGQQ